MITIDEAKEKMLKQAEMHEKMASVSITENAKNNHLESVYEWNQIAEWLEELKTYKKYGVINKESFDKGYVEAVDDFERIMCDELKNYIANIDYMPVGLTLHKFVTEYAALLKDGVSNDD